MRSNIARTCPSGSVPEAAPAVTLRALLGVAAGGVAAAGLSGVLVALELSEEVDERLLVLLRHARIGGHRRCRVLERSPDRRLRQLVGDVGQLRAGAVVAVVA